MKNRSNIKRRSVKRILIVLGTVIILIAVSAFAMMYKTAAQVNAFVYPRIPMNLVADGEYSGFCDAGLVKAEVTAEVSSHKIVRIELIRHENGLGKPAEAILDQMVRQNTDDVDIVSGATLSSKTIRSAVNSALQKGLTQ